MATASSSIGLADSCPNCGTHSNGTSAFCTDCGTALTQTYSQVQPAATSSPHHAARGLAQMLAINPIAAFFAILVDAMVSAVNLATVEITAPVLWLIAAVVTFVVVWIAQRKWSGDDDLEAFVKALMVSFLVALPTPFPAWLTVPSAVVGTVQMLRNKK